MGLESRDVAQERRHQRASRDDHRDDDACRLGEREQGAYGTGGLPAEQRHGQHHGDDCQVLEDKQCDRHVAGRRCGCPPCGQHLEHDGGAAERHKQAGEHCRAPFDAEGDNDRGDDACGEPDLARPADQEHRRELSHPFEAELDAEREQQEHHPDVSRLVDQVDVADDADPAGADDRTRGEEANDRNDADARRHEGDQCPRNQHDCQFGQ